jgi:omega-6 fatty acid desaturase / acyl-lipid omega-6 desaturase (Delta-12 desaturase)
VLHHYVSVIPFYNADEATDAIKKVMGKHYKSDTEGGPIGFIRSLWKSLRWCGWVEPSAGAEGENKGVLFFRNVNNLGPRPLKLEKEEIKVGKGQKAAKMTVLVGGDSDGEQA